MIIKCERCNSWLASSNIAFLEDHKERCSGEVEIESRTGQILVSRRKYQEEAEYDYRQMIECIVEVSGIKTKVIAVHIRNGKFKILRTSVYDYRHIIGRIIDASDICAVIL